MRRLTLVMVLAGTVLSAVPFGRADAQWVFVARRALGRIEHLQQSGQNGQPTTSVASVVLDAQAARVYAKAQDLARHNTSVQVLADDPVERRLEIAQGSDRVTLSVQELSNSLSQLVILGTGMAGPDSPTSRAVEAVLRVCKELKKACSAER